MAGTEDTINAIQLRISKKGDAHRSALATMDEENHKWLQSTVNDVMKRTNPDGVKNTATGSKPSNAKVAEPAAEVADKENTGKQRGEHTPSSRITCHFHPWRGVRLRPDNRLTSTHSQFLAPRAAVG
jgi:hypothetical protein